jgi:hypothetical protein
MLEFHHPTPDITGAKCSALLAQQFWHQGELVSAINVLFIGLADGSWQRVALDAGLVFWHVEEIPSFPNASQDSEQYGQHPLVDLGARYSLIGRMIESVTTASVAAGDELRIRFTGDTSVILRDRPDRDATELIIDAPAA